MVVSYSCYSFHSKVVATFLYLAIAMSVAPLHKVSLCRDSLFHDDTSMPFDIQGSLNHLLQEILMVSNGATVLIVLFTMLLTFSKFTLQSSEFSSQFQSTLSKHSFTLEISSSFSL